MFCLAAIDGGRFQQHVADRVVEARVRADHEGQAVDELAAGRPSCCRCAGRRRWRPASAPSTCSCRADRSNCGLACRAPSRRCAGIRRDRSPASSGGRRGRRCRGCASRSSRRTRSCGLRRAARPTRRRSARRRRRCRRRSCRRRCRRCDAADVVATDRVFAAVVRGAVAGLRLHAERDRRRGVVEVAQVLDVVAVVAVRVERPGALEMGGHVVAGVARSSAPSTSCASTVLAWPAVPVPAPPAGISFCAVAFQLGSAAFALPVTEQSQLLPTRAADGGVAAARVGVAAIEAVLPLRERGGVAERRVARRSSAASACRRTAGIWPVITDIELCSWPATTDSMPMNSGRFLSAVRYSMSGYWNSCIDCQRHMSWFGAVPDTRPFGVIARIAVLPGRVRARAASCRRSRTRTDRRASPASRLRPACSCGCRCRRGRPARTSRGPRACRSCRSPS